MMGKIMLRVKWKKSATASDMSAALRFCKQQGLSVQPSGVTIGLGWMIYQGDAQ